MHDGIPSPSNGKERPFLVWTRSAADLASDALLLNQHQVDIVHVPCIRVDAIAAGISELKTALADSAVLIFTSQNAVKILNKAVQGDAGLRAALNKVSKVITHGQQTAASATGLFGERVQCIDAPTSVELVGKLTRSINEDPVQSSTIWLRGEDFAFDVAGALQKSGHEAQHIILYRTIATPTDQSGNPLAEKEIKEQAKLIGKRAHNARCVVCFASPSSVTGWLALTSEEPDLHPRHLVAAVIGPTTARAAAAAGFGNIAVCAWPNLQDLISLGASCAKNAN
ncbi:MAG: Uroporphyrinogen-III synthase HemD [Pseudomonadota bacterium]|jgi:uroporphyrinogen-III synthase